MWPSLTFILCGAFVCYIGFSLMVLVDIFFPKSCATPPCLNSYLTIKPSPEFELKVYTSPKLKAPSELDMTLIWNYHNFSLKDVVDKHVNVSIPLRTRNNGSLYAHIFFHLRGREPFLDKHTIHTSIPLTSFNVPQSKVVNLLTDKAPNVSWHVREKPVTHWKSKLTINIVQDKVSFQQHAIPGELYRFIKFSPEGYYLPIVFIDELSNRLSDLQPINKTTKKMELKIMYSPISLGKLRLWTSILESMKTMKLLGFKDKDIDEVKGIFTDTNLVLLLMTFAVSAFHLLFDFLAFKHDINFWRGKKSMEGLSARGVVWRCISTIIIFLYLLDQETSLLVLVPSGIGALIEIWKVKKAFKMNINWNGWRPLIEFGTITDKEQQTEQFDSQAMRYLSYVLYPLCIAGACYSLIYIQYKSWYSWFVNSLVNGVYLFGFLFMLPQLFVNYKLKSVAHLPWRAFMYKAFNTFIDDVFAFIITMPTAHRLACFRDDVVFLIYLYQRWLYPVDKTRVNEFGISYEEEEVNTKDQKQKKED